MGKANEVDVERLFRDAIWVGLKISWYVAAVTEIVAKSATQHMVCNIEIEVEYGVEVEYFSDSCVT